MSRAPTLSLPDGPIADPETFRDACARFTSGVVIATVCDQAGSPHGLTISSFTPVSLRPPLILICVDYASYDLEHFRSNSHFAINVLTALQRDLSVRFSGLREGRFDGLDWYSGSTGAPLLSGALAVLECRVKEIIEAGDHAILIGNVVRAQAHEGQPLVYFNRNYRSIIPG